MTAAGVDGGDGDARHRDGGGGGGKDGGGGAAVAGRDSAARLLSLTPVPVETLAMLADRVLVRKRERERERECVKVVISSLRVNALLYSCALSYFISIFLMIQVGIFFYNALFFFFSFFTNKNMPTNCKIHSPACRELLYAPSVSYVCALWRERA